MTPAALLRTAFRALERRTLRSLLTALTAAVAVATVFAVRGILAGLERAAEEDFGRLGLRTVQVMEGPGHLPDGAPVPDPRPLEPGEVALARAAVAAAGVEAEVSAAWVRLGVLSSPGEGEGAGKPVPVPVVATGPAYLRTFDARLAAGRFLREEDAAPGAEPVCVLDADAAWALRGEDGGEVRPGSEVILGGPGGTVAHRVAGILEDPLHTRPRGHFVDATAGARRALGQLFAFRNVYVPLREGETPGKLMILAVARERADASRVHDALERALGARERGLLVWSRGTWARTVLEMLGDLAQLMNLLWGVVLLVALVMIATVTLVGVRERFAEVAIRRAEGATRRQVVLQLLAEGGLLALAGGLAGLPLGWAAADRLAVRLTWVPVHSPAEGAGAVAVGVAVGLLAAALPAWRAARWPVVEGFRRVA